MSQRAADSWLEIPQDRIADLCRRWKITELALFGSALRDDFRPESDVDVLVTFASEARWGYSDSHRHERGAGGHLRARRGPRGEAPGGDQRELHPPQAYPHPPEDDLCGVTRPGRSTCSWRGVEPLITRRG